MWLPVVVPYVFEPYSNLYGNRSAREMCLMIPVDQLVYSAMNETGALVNFLHITQGFRNGPPYAEDGKKLMLNRSLFNLVQVNHCLELTDRKLLGWYLSLPAEDRTLIQQEGGLLSFTQRHPALEVVGKFVYLKQQFRGNYSAHSTNMSSNHRSRYPTFYGASLCQNCGKSIQFGTKRCRHCGVHIMISEGEVYMSENQNDLELLPSNIREELNVVTAKKEVRQQRYSSPANGAYSAQAQCLSQMWEEVEQTEDVTHFKDPTAQANFSLDMELDMQAHRIDTIQNDQSYMELEGGANFCDMNQETLSEYYRFSRNGLNHTEMSDGSQSMEADYNDSIMATKGSTELSDEPLETTMASAANSADSFSCHWRSLEIIGDLHCKSLEVANDSGDHPEYLQNEDDSRYEQQISENFRVINVGSSLKSTSSVQCGVPFFVHQTVDACGDFRACFTSTRATQVCQVSRMKACKSVATDTDSLPVSIKKATQIMQPSTSDKSTITEVYMADLDVLTEEFRKLKEIEKELKRLKDKKSRPNPGDERCGKVGGCDCAQRVRLAELHLLTLQFVMCQQHCWRCYFTSPLGESAHQGAEALPDIMAETLNTLERDYHEMKREILAGTPLDDLKPLSVDSQKITTGTYYSPAVLLEAHLGLFDRLGSAVENCHTAAENATGIRAPLCLSTEATQDKPKDKSSNRGRPVGFPSQHLGTSSAIKDLNSSDAWFDAEEELGSPNQDENMEKEGKESMKCKIEQKGTDADESDQRSLLCVTCLPNNVTKHEVLLWFEKYNATSVHISTFSNNIRAAVVYLKSPSDARAAVKDLNGCTIQGHSVHVQQLCGPASTHPKGPRCSVDRLTMICDSPTASGTCVPQHHATMGSFNTIMAQLSERHPNLGRQKIVDALLELRAKKQGFLSGLSLRSIVDMTSELLTQGCLSKCA